MDQNRSLLGDPEAILESITDAFFSVDENWEFAYVNHQAEVVLERRADSLLGKSIWAEYPGLVSSDFEKLYRKAARDKVPGAATYYFPDHERWYEVHVYPAGTGISIYFRDVTDRVQAEAKLRESETRFRLMADAIPQIVWITDASGRAMFFNQQWSRYTGIPVGSIMAKEVSDTFVHPDDDIATMQAWDAALREGQVFNVEHRIRSASGEYRWFLVRAEPHRDPDTGKIVNWFGTSTDVHDRKIAEAAQKKSEERYRTLFESIDEGFCILELLFDGKDYPVDYRYLETNGVFEQQSGLYSAKGKTIRELAPEIERFWIDIYGNVALSGEPIRFQNESKALNRWFDVYAFRVDEPSDRRVAVLFKDITERRRMEHELQQSDRRKDEFLAMLAHELRNPLAPIGAAADLLRLAPLDSARVKQTSEIISRQVRHMTSLVDDLLDVSRVTRGLITLDRMPLDAKRIVADAVEQVRPLIEARRHQLLVDMPPDAAYVMGDQKRLVQVVANLLNNAAKYTPEGGRIVMTAEVKDKHVMLSVTDNGIGLAPDLVDHVFELFAQAERTSDRAQGGLGIGLALVKSLTELHYGTVTASSNGTGQGSNFTVCLPLVVKPGEPSSLERNLDVPMAPKKLRLMVVDDNPDAARMLAMFLEAAGYEVLVEHDAKTAIERARTERPDVYLLDIGLPDLDGNDLARYLTSQPETVNSLLIAISGYGQEQDRKKTADAGFDYHFVKPVDTARLAELLARHGNG